MENDPVVERSVDFGIGFEPDAVEFCAHIAQRFDADLESEGHFERALARPRTFQFDLVGIFVHPHENLRERDVLLRVEVGREILEGENVIADENALPGIDPTKSAAGERPAAHRDALGAVVLEQNQVVITKGQQPVITGEAFERDVGISIPAERDRFER